jgi:hypothetical protein
MKVANQVESPIEPDERADGDELFTLLSKAAIAPSFAGVVTGELVALATDGRTPLVTFPGQPTASAAAARSVVDLHGAHVGSAVVLLFDGGDPSKPIVMGVLRSDNGWPLSDRPGQVDVTPDGERLVVTAKEQLVLRCGKASITLTSDGKVMIDGAYVCSRSSGVNRIKGGSVQLN